MGFTPPVAHKIFMGFKWHMVYIKVVGFIGIMVHTLPLGFNKALVHISYMDYGSHSPHGFHVKTGSQ